MSKKKGEGLKSFNRGFNVPDTYIIIFFVVAGLPISTGDFANSPILFAVVPTTWILKGATFGSYIFSTGFLLAAISSGFLLTSVKRA